MLFAGFVVFISVENPDPVHLETDPDIDVIQKIEYHLNVSAKSICQHLEQPEVFSIVLHVLKFGGNSRF